MVSVTAPASMLPPRLGLEQSQLGNGFRLRDHFDESDIEAATVFLGDCYDLFLPDLALTLPDSKAFVQDLKTLSWWLAGIAVLCDWLGTNSALLFKRIRVSVVPTFFKKSTGDIKGSVSDQ